MFNEYYNEKRKNYTTISVYNKPFPTYLAVNLSL